MTQFRTSENQIAKVVLERLLPEIGGVATIARIRLLLPHYLELNDNDRAPSPTRRGEQLWEQQVRNIVCHRDCPDNYVYQGRLVYRRNRLMLPANDAPLLRLL